MFAPKFDVSAVCEFPPAWVSSVNHQAPLARRHGATGLAPCRHAAANRQVLKLTDEEILKLYHFAQNEVRLGPAIAGCQHLARVSQPVQREIFKKLDTSSDSYVMMGGNGCANKSLLVIIPYRWRVRNHHKPSVSQY